MNSPELVVSVQRQTKSLSFQPFVAAMLPKLLLVDKDTMKIVKRNMDGNEGDWGLIPDTHRETWPAIAPGPQLDLMIQSMLSTSCRSWMNLLARERQQPPRICMRGRAGRTRLRVPILCTAQKTLSGGKQALKMPFGMSYRLSSSPSRLR